jgi:hypothetical protein
MSCGNKLWMSEQGPGGYGGGPPPGGWGPPPGSPPGAPPGGYGVPPAGGYGQPPGGYGQPPGGYGQPPGAPQGFPQHGVAPTQPGIAPAPGKKTNPIVWLGLGCGALLLVGGAGAAWFYFSVFRPAQEIEHAVAAASGLGATVSIGSSGLVVKIPGLGEVAAPTTPSPGGAAPSPTSAPTASTGIAKGGPNCDAAAACCKAMASKAGAQAQTIASCDALKSSPDFACAQALATYKKMAPLVGVTCP